MKTTVFMSGASCFTGCHIARSFVQSGFSVVGALTRSREVYQKDPLLSGRLSYSGIQNWIEEFTPSKQSSLDALVSTGAQVWVGHGAPISGYRSPDFDFMKSFHDSIQHMKESLEVFKKHGGQLYIHTGTVFEADEGVGELPGMSGVSEALSPYGMSKNLVWQALRFFCSQIGLPIIKIVIPNPIGGYENPDRMIPIFARKWMAGERPQMMLGQLVRDQLPAPWLAAVYAKEIKEFFSQPDRNFRVRTRRPSGFVMTQRSFIELCQKEFSKRVPSIHYDCSFESRSTLEPLERFNSETVVEMNSSEARKVFFDEWCDFLFSNK